MQTMKKVKPILAGLLAAAMLLLGACSSTPDDPSGSNSNPGGDPTGTPTGRFVEKDVTPPGAEGGGLRLFSGVNGLVCFDRALTTRWDSADGGDSWTETPVTGLDEKLTVDSFTYDKFTDSIILSAYDETMSYGLYTLGADGTLAPLPSEDYDRAAASGEAVHILGMEVVAENRLLLNYYLPGANSFSFGGSGPAGATDTPEGDASLPEGDTSTSGGDTGLPDDAGTPEGDASTPEGDGDGASFMAGGGQGLYDLSTGAKVNDLADWDGGFFTAEDGTLWLMGYDGRVSRHDAATGERQGEPVPLALDMDRSLRTAFALDGKLAFLHGSTLYTLATDAAAPETLIDGSALSFGSLAAYITGGAQAGGAPLLALEEEDGTRLCRYDWDPNATVDPTKTLEVWSLYDDMTVRAALLEFAKQHPDATITYNPVLAGDETGQSVTDAIKALNTRLLAGDSPDIMILDGCPVESLSQKGMLKDLTEYVDTAALLPSVLKAFQTDKGLFTLPARAKVPVLVGAPDLLAKMDTLQNMVDTAASGPDRPVVSGDDMFSALPEGERPVFNFGDWDEMYKLLLAVCQPGFMDGDGLNAAGLETFLEAVKGLSDKYGLTTYQAEGAIGVSTNVGMLDISQSMLNHSVQTAAAGAMNLTDAMIAGMMMLPEDQMATLPGAENGAWLPSTIAGIGIDSKNPEFAGQFISTLFSDAVQAAGTTGSGLPVTGSGIAKVMENAEKQGEATEQDYSAAIEQAKTLLENMGAPVFADDVLSETIRSAAYAYCDGSLDLQGAVNQIEQELKNYLAERA